MTITLHATHIKILIVMAVFMLAAWVVSKDRGGLGSGAVGGMAVVCAVLFAIAMTLGSCLQ